MTGRAQRRQQSAAAGRGKYAQTLTDRLIRSLKPEADEHVIWDTIVPSLGIRVLPSGVKTFILGACFPNKYFTRLALAETARAARTSPFVC
jgi:hypothetical protein